MGILGETAGSSQMPVHPETEALPGVANLRPCDLVRLLNSTPLGKVICDRQFYRHRMRAGERIGLGRRVNLCRYTAWLVGLRQARHGRESRPEGNLNARNILRLLDHQNRRCALTGQKLTPGTAALDHIVPVCHDGEHCIENAQVLHKDVNRAKGTLTNEQFIQLCREVVAYVSKTALSRQKMERNAGNSTG